MNNPIPSPYQLDFSKYEDSFDTYDDLPATTAWLQSIGAALGKKFNVSVTQNAEKEWEIDYAKKEMQVGSIDEIYTRRGVLGLLLNGVGRLAKGIRFPTTKSDAKKFAVSHGVDEKFAKHIVALSKTIDEVRTDDAMAHEYAGGERVVDTMHAQAYEAANKALQVMALDMRARREMARTTLQWLSDFMGVIERVEKEPLDGPVSKGVTEDAAKVMEEFHSVMVEGSVQTTLSSIMHRIEESGVGITPGRAYATLLIALNPKKAQTILNVLVRSYGRNLDLFDSHLGYEKATRPHEEEIVKVAGRLTNEIEEIKLFASHTGGHAQYVIAKAEQYYHAFSLGIEFITPYGGYDIEAKALEVEKANEAAHEIASKMMDNGITADIGDSIRLAKDLLPLVEPFPFLDLNDQKKQGNSQGGSMMKRVAGGQGQGNRKTKRKKEREKKSASDRAKDRKKMESLDNKKNQEKLDEQRRGYSILEPGRFDPLEAYLYIIGPYLNRISSMAAKFRRILKVNDPMGLRGAYNRGKALNPKILYRHRLNDYRLFARREQEKEQSYGFAIVSDISGSTAQVYSNKNNRTVQDEVMAAGFLVAEIAERIGEKLMCSITVFDDKVQEVKRAGFYLNRQNIMKKIKHHSGGTNVAAAGESLEPDLQEMEDFKMKQKTIVFITDGQFSHYEFMDTVKTAKKFKASIAYFQICDNVQYGVQMCKELEKFVAQNAKGVRVRTRNITTGAINTLPEAMAQLMKETIGVSAER